MQGVILISKVIFATCCVLAAAASSSGRAPAQSPSRPADAGSADYLFGFASAAMTACPLEPGAAWQKLRTLVSTTGAGEVPQDLTRGFAAFATLSERLGAAAACDQAISLFGPAGSARKDLVEISRLR